MKGQASLEYIIIVGALLVILIPLFYYAANTSSESIKLSQAEDVVETLGRAADDVYLLSPGTKKYVWVSLPGSVQGVQLNGTEIALTFNIYGKTSDVTTTTKAPLTGQIPLRKGTYRIAVEHLDSGIVLIGEGNDTAAPNVVWKSPDGEACNPITLRATTDEAALCRFDTADESYDTMTFQMTGNALGHSSDQGVQAEGSFTYYVRCSDAFHNVMESSAVIGYSINNAVCTGDQQQNETDENETNETGTSLTDIGIDTAWYFKTNGNALATEDGGMVSWDVITPDLLDDNINTPATTYVVRTRNGWKYEGFVAHVNEGTGGYKKIVLYGRVRIIDTGPYILRVYPYKADGAINTTGYAEFSIPSSILNEKVKWVELDITSIAKTEDGFGWLRTRITALNNSAQDNNRFQFSELHYKVG